MTEFDEGRLGKFSKSIQKEEDMSSFGNKKGGKPQVELYRPGSGPLRKSTHGEEEFFGDGAQSRSDNKSNTGRDRRDGPNRSRTDVYKLSDDFDRLSVCSNSSRKEGRSASLRGSTGNLTDSRRRNKKPEVPIYMPPKPSTPLPSHQENKKYKSKNYSNSQRSDSFKREDSFKQDSDSIQRDGDSIKRENDTFKRDGGKVGNSHWLDTRSLRGESEPPLRRPNDRSRKPKKSKKRNIRAENKDENVNQMNGNKETMITPLLDIKFDFNPLTKVNQASNNYDGAGYETSGYTTTDCESERDPLCSMRNTKPLPSRNMRQASEPRCVPFNSIQTENRSRDTRSVEPFEENSWSHDRFNQKPPSGQYGKKNNKPMHSKNRQYHLSFDSLPPRLQKKYMEENGLKEPPVHCSYTSAGIEKPYMGSNPDLSYGGTDSEPNYCSSTNTPVSYLIPNPKPNYLGIHTTFIGTNSEDPWDGSSVTFQGTTPSSYYTNVPPPSLSRLPPPHVVCSQLPPPPLWSQTLPHARTRGRGRVPHHELERERIAFEESRMARSLTPDALIELERFEQPTSLPVESLGYQNNKETIQISQGNDFSRPLVVDEKLSNQHNQEDAAVQSNDNNSAATNQKSPAQPKSPQDLTFKKASGTGMNWADEVELSERLQETLEEKESEDNTYSLSNSNVSPVSQPTITPHKDRRRRRKRKRGRGNNDRSISRERYHTNDRRRSSLDMEDTIPALTRSRKNSGDDKHSVSRSRKNSGDDRNWPRSRKNSGDDRNWPRSRKNSGDDRNWRRDENRDPFDNFKHPKPVEHKFSSKNSSRNNSRNNSRSNSRNNSVERWTQEEYQNLNGSERKFGGNGGERFRRNSTKTYPSDRHFTNPPRRRGSRDHSGDRQKEQPKQEENWRDEARRLNGPGPLVEQKKQQKPAGILVLPQSTSPHKEMESSNKSLRNNLGPHTQRQLFDPSNPHRPLIVNTPTDSGRIAGYPPYGPGQHMMSPDGQFVVPMPPPIHMLHNPNLLKEAEVIDYELNRLLMSSSWYEYHDDITSRRSRLQEILWRLLTSDIKFCEQENIEQYFWKILYYNLLELLRNQMGGAAPQNKETFLKPLLNIIEEGMKYFENTLRLLEECYKFKLDEHLLQGYSPAKGKPHLTMALMSAQKILLFLGDLARYREQVQDTSNYGVARHFSVPLPPEDQEDTLTPDWDTDEEYEDKLRSSMPSLESCSVRWYIKAHQINPKNGRPYNQLAILAVYARRKLDAVYYYMRSLIATIPVASSKESLLTLFDENRKKFEQLEKQRQEERELRDKEKMKEKEFETKKSLQLRREIWVHPEGGRRVHRTTSTAQATYDDSEAELEALSHVDLMKRFSMSFIHVHGKLFTKIGMESFQGAALQMLREFRSLLQHSPLPVASTKLLQLLALNMFAIENTQLKNSDLGPGYRSVLQESALVTSLQMFSLIMERTVQLLRDQLNNTYQLIVSDDVQILLPAIKVWCDWLLCHSGVWNPPPSCHDYRVGSAGDVWGRLAALVNLLEKLDHQQHLLSEKCLEGYEQVRLPEDAAMGGFLPLMFNCPDPMYTSKENNMEAAQVSLRIHKILFCGTVFLCGVDPPVLKLQKDESGSSEYISVVETPSPPTQSDGELCVESVSGGDSEDSGQASEEEGENSPANTGGGEMQSLLQRKHELERSHRRQKKRQQKVQSILQSSLVSVEIEVRPHYLIADTNCFIDYLPHLQVIARASSPTRPHIYTLMVPLVVLNELDGLAHGRRDASARPEHLAMVTECAASALDFLRSRSTPAVRCVTTKGTILNSATFTSEEDCQDMKNDDKILTTCLKLCHSSSKEDHVEGQPRKISREVVLLTEDRNLRVKALARDVPVREVSDFMHWAGLELG